MSKKDRQPVGAYVPPHLRGKQLTVFNATQRRDRLNEDLNPSGSSVSSSVSNGPPPPVDNVVLTTSGDTESGMDAVDTVTVPPPASDSGSNSNNVNYVHDTDSEDIEKAIRSSIVVSGFLEDLSDLTKEAMLEQFYKLGGRVKWLCSEKALVVFANDALVVQAVSVQNYTTALKVESLSDLVKLNDHTIISGEFMSATVTSRLQSNILL